MVEKSKKKEYRLKGVKYTVVIAGEKKHYKKGDLVPLTATQAIAFKDQFEDPDAKKKRLQLQKDADVKTKTDAKEAEDAKKRRTKELEDRKEADRKAAQDKIAADKKTVADKVEATKKAAVADKAEAGKDPQNLSVNYRGSA